MSRDVPTAYEQFRKDFPEIWAAYDQLGTQIHSQGALDEKTRQLVKLALAIGVRAEGAVHAHTRKCLAVGVTPEEIRQVVLLSITTAGFPTAMAAMTWVDDILKA